MSISHRSIEAPSNFGSKLGSKLELRARSSALRFAANLSALVNNPNQKWMVATRLPSPVSPVPAAVPDQAIRGVEAYSLDTISFLYLILSSRWYYWTICCNFLWQTRHLKHYSPKVPRGEFKFPHLALLVAPVSPKERFWGVLHAPRRARIKREPIAAHSTCRRLAFFIERWRHFLFH